MRREEAIAALRGYLPEIRREFGVRRIALFGSTFLFGARSDRALALRHRSGNGKKLLDRGEALAGAHLQEHVRPVDREETDARPRTRCIVGTARPQQPVC